MNESTSHLAQPKPTDLEQVIARFDREIERFIRSMDFPSNLSEAILYAVLGGGKRIRPVLAWYSSIACGGNGRDAIPAGIAVELIHAFSLIHDDLPALDDDDLRRGKPTLHIHTNEPMAILAGDALLSLAYESPLAHTDDSVAVQLIKELANGTRSMIVGQVYDTLGGMSATATQRQQLEDIHRNKTGALLVASCRMGAISANADQRQLESVTQYAHAIGLQFQIVDDLLDVLGTSDHVGKAIGKDSQAGKLTYPSVIGIENSQRVITELAQEASLAIKNLDEIVPGAAQPLKLIGDMLTARTK